MKDDVKCPSSSRPGLCGRTFVHLSTRSPPSTFLYFYGPSSAVVHEMDGLSSSTSVHLGQIIMVRRPKLSMRWTVCLCPAVHLRPSMTNNYGPLSESVHPVDGSYSSDRPPPSISQNHQERTQSKNTVFKMMPSEKCDKCEFNRPTMIIYGRRSTTGRIDYLLSLRAPWCPLIIYR